MSDIPALPAAPGVACDTGLSGMVAMHLRSHSESFRAGARGARLCDKARRVSLKVLQWWREQGSRQSWESLADAEGSAMVFIGGWLVSLLGQYALTWLAKLVVKLLIEWLITRPSQAFASMAYQPLAPSAASF